MDATVTNGSGGGVEVEQEAELHLDVLLHVALAGARVLAGGAALAEIFDEPLTDSRRASSQWLRVVADKSPASTGSRGRPGESSCPGAPVPSARQAGRPTCSQRRPDPFLRPRPAPADPGKDATKATAASPSCPRVRCGAGDGDANRVKSVCALPR